MARRPQEQQAQEQQPQQQQDDPTVSSSRRGVIEYPEGTHPPAPPEDQAWGPGRFSYSDMPDDDKPDKSSVVSVIESDPLTDEAQEALREAAQQPTEPQPEGQEQQ